MTRRERRDEHFANPHLHAHLYARDKDDSNPPPELTAPTWDFFKVSKSDCHTGWGKMEEWDLVDVKHLKCGSDIDKVTLIRYLISEIYIKSFVSNEQTWAHTNIIMLQNRVLNYRKSVFVVHNFHYKLWSEHLCGFVSLVGCGKTKGTKMMHLTTKKHFRSNDCFEDSK